MEILLFRMEHSRLEPSREHRADSVLMDRFSKRVPGVRRRLWQTSNRDPLKPSRSSQGTERGDVRRGVKPTHKVPVG